MTPREHKSMVAMKRAYDAFYALPLSVRGLADEMRNEIDALYAVIKSEYKSEVRNGIVKRVKESNVNFRIKQSTEI